MDNTQKLFILGLGILLATFVCSIIIAIIRKKKRKLYIQNFNECYKNKSVLESLEIISNLYKPNSNEYKAINKSINYLNKSCLKDYQTAFAIIEDVIEDNSIIDFHNKILDIEKRKIVLLLEKED